MSVIIALKTMKNKLLKTFILTGALLGLFSINHNLVFAIPVEQVVNPRQYSGGWVSDQAKLLSPNAIAQINQLISQLKTKTGTEVAVVTVIDTYPSATPKEFATELYNRWGVGQKGQDNGVLLLVAIKERRVEIETGYGVEGILPDSKVGNIIRTYITPRFKAGDYQGGIMAGTEALVQELSNESFDATQPENESLLPLFLVVGAGTAGLAGAATYWKNRKRYLSPQGRSQGYNPREKSKFSCAECKNLMGELDIANLQQRLNVPQKYAKELRSTIYRGWQCPKCATPPQENKFHLRSYRISSLYNLCPNCEEYTLKQTNYVVREATLLHEGVLRTVSECPCCSLYHEQDSLIPRETPVVIYTNSGGGGGGGFGGGGGSSGGDFGGGSSGGGGAGDSW